MSADRLIEFLVREHDGALTQAGDAVSAADNAVLAELEAGILTPVERAALLERAAKNPELRRRMGAILQERAESVGESTPENRTPPRIAPDSTAAEVRQRIGTTDQRPSLGQRRLLHVRPILALAACLILAVTAGLWYRGQHGGHGTSPLTGPVDPWAAKLTEARELIASRDYAGAAHLAEAIPEDKRQTPQWREVAGRARLGDALAMADTRALDLIDLGNEVSPRGIRATRDLTTPFALSGKAYSDILAALGVSSDRPGASPELLALATRAALAANMNEDAEKFARAWTAADDRSALAHDALGLALWGQDQIEAAAAEFETTLKLDPAARSAHLNAAAAYDQAGRHPGAISHLQQYLDASTNDPRSPQVRGWLERLRSSR